MHRRLICRRLVALAAAYAIALNMVSALLPAFAPAAEAGAATGGATDLATTDLTTLAQMCGTGQSGERSDADPPNRHGRDCPFGWVCLTLDCSTTGSLAVGVHGGILLAPASATPLHIVSAGDAASRRRAIGAPFARAPPRA
jgi:hypothetical protein